MARSSVGSSLSHRPQWPSTPVGRSENGATITETDLQNLPYHIPTLQLTIEFENDFREPVRYYRVSYTGSEWINTTPDKPAILDIVLEWLNEAVGAPSLGLE